MYDRGAVYMAGGCVAQVCVVGACMVGLGQRACMIGGRGMCGGEGDMCGRDHTCQGFHAW